jgi:hypothetical protein
LPNGQTVHGFGQDAQGELYALATNTPSSGTGGVIYKISGIPEPGAGALLFAAALALAGCRRRGSVSALKLESV